MKLSSPVRLDQLAKLLNCTFLGQPEHQIFGINEIHGVQAGDLTFVDVKKYYQKALSSAATTILINKAVEVPEGKALIVSEAPFRDFNRLLEHFQPLSPADRHGTPQFGQDVVIGQGVVFGENVVLEDGVQIGHNCVIGSDVRIGAHSRLFPQVTLYDHTTIGQHSCINSGTVIGGEAFYFKSLPDRKEKMLTKGSVVIGNNVDIGSNCSIDRGISGPTRIGDYTKLDNLVQVGHDCQIGQRCLIAAQVGIAGVVILEDDVILWGQVGVTPKLTIGKGAELYGKAGVMSSLEGGKKYLGMVAVDARQKLREIAALRKLPEFMAKWKDKTP
ncbi:MAG: UDP-3-O-(3-hydroxymyristoyl)glucosamine N-acyltransferase [Bacteroidota bacterium]